MERISVELLLDRVKDYSDKEKELIYKAYKYAEMLHDGQFRQSGDPYIMHPLNVAYILSEMHADTDTLCAALLHDTLEDTTATKEDIEHFFNQNIADLVDGVTKISKLNFSSKQEQRFANTRKIIIGLTSDVRIIIIKLADRLHNMRTLQYKSEPKQKENALETLEIFVPLAYYIGAYKIKLELEDLSFKFLYQDEYKRISDIRRNFEEESKSFLEDMISVINGILLDKNIPCELKWRVKNIYGIYKKLREGSKLIDIHDLLALKVMVDDLKACYYALGLIHKEYHPINHRFKDYICNPKTNMYRSLHTTVFGPNDRLIQTQIRTHEMDKVASFGLIEYWNNVEGDVRQTMQKDLQNKYQFYRSLVEIDDMFSDNQDFVNQVKIECFSDKVYVYTTKGETIELPKGATAIDFAYRIHTAIGNRMVGVEINDRQELPEYVLQNKDRVKIITSDSSEGPAQGWLESAITANAKRKIREGLAKKSIN